MYKLKYLRVRIAEFYNLFFVFQNEQKDLK